MGIRENRVRGGEKHKVRKAWEWNSRKIMYRTKNKHTKQMEGKSDARKSAIKNEKDKQLREIKI